MTKQTVYFPEIFQMVGEAETRKDKIAVLHKYQHVKGFFDIIKLSYDPKCEWVVSREDIEYLKYHDMDIPDYDLAPTTLFLEARRRLYNFTNARKPKFKKEKVKTLIARMFSGLYHEEIELFKQMVDGRIEERGLTENLVREAFPGLLNDMGDESVEETSRLTEGNMLSNTKPPSVNKHPSEAPPAPKPKSKDKIKNKVSVKKSKLDLVKTEIHDSLRQKKSKSSIAKEYKISISGFNNWLKKNPLEES